MVPSTVKLPHQKKEKDLPKERERLTKGKTHQRKDKDSPKERQRLTKRKRKAYEDQERCRLGLKPAPNGDSL